METALRVLHAALAAALVTAHIAFFFRGLPIESGRIKPGRLDHLARRLSQVLLPLAALSGLIARLAVAGSGGRSEVGEPTLSVLHLLLGLAPLAAIPIVFFGRLALKSLFLEIEQELGVKRKLRLSQVAVAVVPVADFVSSTKFNNCHFFGMAKPTRLSGMPTRSPSLGLTQQTWPHCSGRSLARRLYRD